MSRNTAPPATKPEKVGRVLGRVFAWAQQDAPLYIIIIIGFAGSFTNEVQVAIRHGKHGTEAVATAACIDLLCFVAAKERQRDKRIGRPRKGWVSAPMMFIVFGVLMTLAMNYATAAPGFWGVTIGVLPGVVVLLTLGLLERRESFRPLAPGREGDAGSGTAQNQAAQRRVVPDQNQALAQNQQVQLPPGNQNQITSGNQNQEPTGPGTRDGADTGSGSPRTASGPAARRAAQLPAVREPRSRPPLESDEGLQRRALETVIAHWRTTGKRMTNQELAFALSRSKKIAGEIRHQIKAAEDAAIAAKENVA